MCRLTLDLDAFKTVNDVLGHGTGDRLLQAAALRLREVAPARAVVARVGGDEFAVLLPGAVPEAQQLGDELIAAVRRACGDVPGVNRVGSVGERRARRGPRAGVGCRSAVGALAAGAAQQLAKAAGRDRVQVFDDEVARMRRAG